jgi:soluble lytic murein transglycosylase
MACVVNGALEHPLDPLLPLVREANHGKKTGVRRWHTLALVIVLVTVVCVWWWRASLENRYDVVILAAARRHGVDPALVKAVVWRESRFNQHARGAAGEIGLMQVNKLAAQEWAAAEGLRLFRHEDLFDPGKNTLAGTWYLRTLLRRYEKTDNPVSYALADYNAGRNNVRRWMRGPALSNSAAFVNQIDFPGTKRYVQTIMSRYEHYRPIFPREK